MPMPRRDRVARRRDLHLLAPNDDLPAVGRVHAVEDAHQGGLAGPVLPDERMHLTGTELEVTSSFAMTPGNRFVMCSRTTRAGRSRAPLSS